MSVDGFIEGWSNLKLSHESLSFAARLITFCRWRAKPIPAHLSVSMTQMQIQDFIRHDISIGRGASDLSHLKAMESDVIVTPYSRDLPPEPKPTLLFMICSIFHSLIENNPKLSSDELIAALSDFDVIMPRNPLLKILASTQTWTLHAYRPLENGPLMIERSESYSTNPGSIGMLFKSAVINKSSDYRVYAITEVKLNNLSIVLSGTIDCVDDDGKIVTVKTRPAWVNPLRVKRGVDALLQAKLGGATTIVLGQFSGKKGQKGPVTFAKSKLRKDAVDDFPDRLISAKTELRLKNCHRLLQSVIEKCHKTSVLYQVSGSGYNHAAITIQEINVDENQFPISKTISNCAKAIVSKNDPK